MNWLDYSVFLLIMSSAVGGLTRGLMRELSGLMGFFGGLYIAMRYHDVVALAVDAERGDAPWARTIAFVVIALAVWIAAELAGLLMARTIDVTSAQWFDRTVGAAFGGLRGFVVAGIVLLLADYLGASQVPVRDSALGGPAVEAARVITGRVWHEVQGADGPSYERKDAHI